MIKVNQASQEDQAVQREVRLPMQITKKVKIIEKQCME